jgi:hypothetical protein
MAFNYFIHTYNHSFLAPKRYETSLDAGFLLRRDVKSAICIVVAQIHYTARGDRWRTILVSPRIYQLPDAYSCINELDMRGFAAAVACNLICAKTLLVFMPGIQSLSVPPIYREV